MNPDKRKLTRERGQAPGGPARDVDPDQPFPDDPAPQGIADVADRNLDQAYEGKEHGEGNYQAAGDYGKRVRSFVRSGQADRAARNPAPRSSEESRELAEAERQGRKRSDPSLKRDARKHR